MKTNEREREREKKFISSREPRRISIKFTLALLTNYIFCLRKYKLLYISLHLGKKLIKTMQHRFFNLSGTKEMENSQNKHKLVQN